MLQKSTRIIFTFILLASLIGAFERVFFGYDLETGTPDEDYGIFGSTYTGMLSLIVVTSYSIHYAIYESNARGFDRILFLMLVASGILVFFHTSILTFGITLALGGLTLYRAKTARLRATTEISK